MTDFMEAVSLEASLDDLKAIYRVLSAHKDAHPDLDDNSFYNSLGRLLRRQAQADGVDPDDDEAWRGWLRAPDGGAPVSRDSGLLN